MLYGPPDCLLLVVALMLGGPIALALDTLTLRLVLMLWFCLAAARIHRPQTANGG